MDGMHRAEFKSSKAMRKTIYLSSPKRYKRLAEYSSPNENFLKTTLDEKENDLLVCNAS